MAMLLDLGTTILAFVVLLTVLVFVHEMGHYLVARWCGVRVEVFSIGFGPEIYGWFDRRETRWKISAVPLGGYVKFFGDLNATSAPDSEHLDGLTEEQRKVAFHHKSILQRVAIVVAGPLANMIYAVLVLAIIFWAFGQRVTPPEIGRVLPDGAGQTAGFQQGDVILEIDGKGIARYSEVVQAYLMNPNRELVFLLRRDGEKIELRATPSAVTTDALDGIEREVGELGILPASRALVGKVRPGSAAETAGFVAGDRIVAIGADPIDSFQKLQDFVRASEGRPLRITVLRERKPIEIVVRARHEAVQLANGSSIDGWFLGIESAPRPLVRYDPARATLEAFDTSWSLLVQSVDYIGEMISGERGTEDLGGPLRIAHYSGQAARVGIEQLVMLSVLLSLNLGVINLLPVPVLDGGHLLLYAFEAIRGRPLTDRMQEYAYRFGLALIVMLAVFVTWNDLVQLKVVEFIAGIF